MRIALTKDIQKDCFTLHPSKYTVVFVFFSKLNSFTARNSFDGKHTQNANENGNYPRHANYLVKVSEYLERKSEDSAK